MRCLTLIAVAVVIQVSFSQQKPKGFYAVEYQIAEGESSLGKNRWHVNKNGTVDAGYYQVNSSHCVVDLRSELGRIIHSIFGHHGISLSMADRIAALYSNDELNFSVANAIYQIQGIQAWTSMRKSKVAPQKVQSRRLYEAETVVTHRTR